MACQSMTLPAAHPKARPQPGALLILGLLILLAVGLPAAHSRHAEKHPEAPAIRRCLDLKGPAFVYRSFDRETLYLACRIDEPGPYEGRWGFQAVKRAAEDAGQWVEKSAFIRGDGTLGELLKYLERWGTRFRGAP